MTTTHTFLLFATVATLGACTDKDIDASNDSGTAGMAALAADDTGAMDTGDYDTGILAADADADADDEADPTVPEDTGVYEKDLSTGCSESSERTALDNVGTMPAATDLGSAIGPAVAAGLLAPESNDWYGLCVSAALDGPDAAFWWTPPITGTYTMSTFGSSPWTDTILTVLTLGHGGFSPVTCNDDSQLEDPGWFTGHSPDYYHSLIENQVFIAGNQYLIVVEAYAQPNIEYQLNIALTSVSETGDPGTIDSDRGE
jgi:hypothetical protein